MPQIALQVLSNCLLMFKAALSTDPVEWRYTEDVEFWTEKVENSLKKLNNTSRSNTYAFIHPKSMSFSSIFAQVRSGGLGKTRLGLFTIAQ